MWASVSPPDILVGDGDDDGKGDSNVPSGNIRAAPWSYLAIARPGIDDKTLRLFYQEESNGTFPIREVRYEDEEGSWTVQELAIEGAAKGSCLSAVSVGKTGRVRLYFRSNDNVLRVAVWDGEMGSWKKSKNTSFYRVLSANGEFC